MGGAFALNGQTMGNSISRRSLENGLFKVGGAGDDPIDRGQFAVMEN